MTSKNHNFLNSYPLQLTCGTWQNLHKEREASGSKYRFCRQEAQLMLT